MKLKYINPEPVFQFPFLNVPPRSAKVEGNNNFQKEDFSLFEAIVNTLPDHVDGIFVLSDLQGFMKQNGSVELMGEVLPEELSVFLEIAYPEIAPENVGVILGGDLFALPHRRGGMGDATEVWKTFANHFRWVAGVSGNHDMIGNGDRNAKSINQIENIFHLDGNIEKVDGLTLGGVSGIIGNPLKINRKDEHVFLDMIGKVSQRRPDILILHQGPDFSEDGFLGNPEVRNVIEKSQQSLVICGHCHWAEPLRTLPNGTQVLNVDHRGVFLKK